jgi:ABC-type sugar transport system ATPase subunit
MVLADQIAILDHGQLQQVGPPMGVYDRPVNVTVARFLGEPAMNVFEVPVTVVDGQRSYRIGASTFPAHPPVAERFVGDLALIGIRPESIRLVTARDAHTDSRPPLDATVRRSEVRGSTTVVHVEIPGTFTELATVVHGIGPRVGDVVGVTIDPAQFHLFDRYTEAALHHPV